MKGVVVGILDDETKIKEQKTHTHILAQMKLL